MPCPSTCVGLNGREIQGSSGSSYSMSVGVWGEDRQEGRVTVRSHGGQWNMLHKLERYLNWHMVAVACVRPWVSLSGY